MPVFWGVSCVGASAYFRRTFRGTGGSGDDTRAPAYARLLVAYLRTHYEYTAGKPPRRERIVLIELFYSSEQSKPQSTWDFNVDGPTDDSVDLKYARRGNLVECGDMNFDI